MAPRKALVAGLLLAALVSGCGLQNYQARVKTPQTEVEITNKRGALLEVTQADGTRIVADDRGHPRPTGVVENILGVLLMKHAD